MRVLAWVPQVYDTSPGQRFRIEQWEPYLRAQGIEIVWSPFSDLALTRLLPQAAHWGAKLLKVGRALGRRLGEALRGRGFDLVYVFREDALMGPAFAARLLRWSRVPFVFDFDDAVWVRYVSPSNSYLSYLRFSGKTAFLCRGARSVIAGNRFLADYAERHNRQVSIVPTTIDTSRYRRVVRTDASVPVIGWSGSFSTLQHLNLVRPALERLRKRRPFRVVVVGAEGFEATGVQVEHRPWRPETEVADISSFDVGLMPLPDNEWERGKCGLKALQYMALSVPAVVSPVGVNKEIAQDGETGLWARNDGEWEHALERLLDSRELRLRLGAAGRQIVETRYSAAVHAPRVADILRGAAA